MSVTMQRQDGLDRSARRRHLRVQLRGEMKQVGQVEGWAIFADVLECVPEWLEAMDAYKALRLCPAVGHEAAANLLRHAGVTQRTTLGRLTPRQRKLLADLFRGPPAGLRRVVYANRRAA